MWYSTVLPSSINLSTTPCIVLTPEYKKPSSLFLRSIAVCRISDTYLLPDRNQVKKCSISILLSLSVTKLLRAWWFLDKGN